MNKKKLLAIICVFALVMMATVSAFAATGEFASKMLTTAAYNVFGEELKGGSKTTQTVQVLLNLSQLYGPGMI